MRSIVLHMSRLLRALPIQKYYATYNRKYFQKAHSSECRWDWKYNNMDYLAIITNRTRSSHTYSGTLLD